MLDGNWHNADVTVGLSASDPGAPTTGSGVATIKYQVDSGTLPDDHGQQRQRCDSSSVESPRTTASTRSAFFATDNRDQPGDAVEFGHGQDRHDEAVLVDRHESIDARRHEQLVQAVERELLRWAHRIRAAPTTGSGVAERQVTRSMAAAFRHTSATVTINTQGDHTVAFFATDNAGNVESTNTAHIEIDNVTPSTTLTTTPWVAGRHQRLVQAVERELHTWRFGRHIRSRIAHPHCDRRRSRAQAYAGAVTDQHAGRSHRHVLVD